MRTDMCVRTHQMLQLLARPFLQAGTVNLRPARRFDALLALDSYGLDSYGLHSYGVYSYGAYSYGRYSYGRYSYGLYSGSPLRRPPRPL